MSNTTPQKAPTNDREENSSQNPAQSIDRTPIHKTRSGSLQLIDSRINYQSGRSDPIQLHQHPNLNIKMEVASPLTFGHVKAGSKRRFATCSPLNTPAIEPNVDDYAMDDSSAYGSSFKRRRCDNMEMSHVPTPNMNNPFGSSQLSSPQVHTPAFGKFNHVYSKTWD